jgi:acetyl esterase/lipase
MVLLTSACAATTDATTAPPSEPTTSPTQTTRVPAPPTSSTIRRSGTTTSSTSTTTSTTTMPTTTTSSPTGSTTSTVPDSGNGPGPNGVQIYLPDEPRGAPAVVLVHGGGWVAGTPASTASLAKSLAEAGAIVFNASYRTALTGGGYPATFDDIACAVRYARFRLGELGGSGELILVGHSAGAHISAVVTLSEDAFGPDCPWQGSSTPDRFVGLAGLYEIDAVAPVMDVFLGGDRSEAPDAWQAADPFAHLDAAAGMDIMLVHGRDDSIVPPAASEQFAAALEDAGARVDLELVDGAGHMDMVSPAVTTDLILP